MRIVTWNVNGVKRLLQYKPWNIKKTYEGVLEDLEGDIICIQETKITRAQLDKTLACPINFDAFFSFFQDGGPRGIHGTAIFTKRKTCIPVKAEEGLGAALVPAALTTTERIGGYPEEADVDLSFAEMKQLDVEGRTTVCDFGLFVLINLYCPAERNDQRLIFKNYFNLMVDQRVRRLIAAGRQVIVVGDLNICPEAIDSAEAEEARKKKGVTTYSEHPPRAWLKEFVGPDGPMIDICRRLHPDRTGMYTCWETKIDARTSNYGARLDYVLITPGLLPWIRGSDISREVVGSDHCPVWVDFHDEIEIPGRGTVKLWDEMNPHRDRTNAAGQDPPAFAARFYDEFSGKQKLLSSFFGIQAVAGPSKSPSPRPSTPSTSAPASTSSNTSIKLHPSSSVPVPMISSSVFSTTTTTKGKRKAVVDSTKDVDASPSGQKSIANFFKPPVVEEKKKRKLKKAKKVVEVEETVLDLTGDDDEGDQTRPEMEEGDFEEATSGSAAVPSSSSSSSAWSSIFAQKPVPKCSGHDEPTKTWTVNKPGVNKNRRFFLCQRPVGPGYDKGQVKMYVNSEWRCDYFKWETNVKRPASVLVPSAKKRKT